MEFCGSLLQLRVLGFGLLQDGDVGVGVFPEREEVLIDSSRFGRVALHGVGAAEFEVGKCAHGVQNWSGERPARCIGLGASLHRLSPTPSHRGKPIPRISS